MKKVSEFLGAILCGLAALVGLLAGGIVLVVYSLSKKVLGSEGI